MQEQFREELLGGTMMITAQGWRMDLERFGSGLYSTAAPEYHPVSLKFVPYCFWGNRVPGEMAVWVKYKL